MEYRYDAVIVGAGVVGAAVARALSRYAWKVAVLEKEEDVCCQTSKANSGIVHAGFDAKPGSKKAQFNVEGSRMMEELCRDLDIPYRRCGALVVCTEEERIPELEHLLEQGKQNGVAHLELLRDREAVEELEKNLVPEVKAALYAPDSAIVCPFELTLAMAEQASVNGVDFYFNTEVKQIIRLESGGYRLEAAGTAEEKAGGLEYMGADGAGKKDGEAYTENAVFLTSYVVNAAGVYADVLHNMVCAQKLQITPRRGEYELLDQETGSHVAHTIFTLPDQMGKGVLVTPTVHGNLLLGPTAADIEEKEDTATTREGLEKVREKARRSVSDIPMKQVITSFAGLRAHEQGGDFVIGEAPDAPGFIDCAGIESPGLTASPAIGEAVAGLLEKRARLVRKGQYNKERRSVRRTAALSEQEFGRLIQEEPSYGKVVCRCEKVTEGEILDAIRRPLGARSLDGVKRRTRAGMGRCQSGFCSVTVMKLLSQELGQPLEDITKCGPGSKIAKEKTRGAMAPEEELREEPQKKPREEFRVEPREERQIGPREELQIELREEFRIEPREELRTEPQEEFRIELREETQKEPREELREELRKEAQEEGARRGGEENADL